MLATVVQWLLLASVVGVVVGTACSAFLRVLFLTEGHLYQAPWWLLAVLLPLGGLANGLLLHYAPRHGEDLHDEPIAAVNEQQGRMPWRDAWIKPLAALITLSCGGSAGKEGPCSHLGASLASGLGQWLRLNAELRKRLVACGVSAGFASVFGTPIAGAVYGVEMLAIGRIRHDFLFPGIVAGVTAYTVSRFWGLPYHQFHISFAATFTQLLFLKTVLLGMVCGLAALLFVELCQLARRAFTGLRQRFALWPPLLPAIGGAVVALAVLLIPSDYLGLSLPLMDAALQGEAVALSGVLFKALLVAITLGAGFYGGIVTPQFVIGAIAGSACAPWLGLTHAQGAAVGLVAVVAAASNTPVAALLMGVELFGADAMWYVAGACMAAFLTIGHRSVYPAQHVAYAKSAWLVTHADLPVGQEKVQLSYGVLRWWGSLLKRLRGWWQQRQRRP